MIYHFPDSRDNFLFLFRRDSAADDTLAIFHNLHDLNNLFFLIKKQQ